MVGVRSLSVCMLLVAACPPPANNPPPQYWQQSSAAPPPPAPGSWEQPAAVQPAPPAPATAYTPCQYACGQMSRCQIQDYNGCVAECQRTGAEHQDTGRQYLETISRMTCEQIAAEVRASQSTASSTTASSTSAPTTASAPPSTPTYDPPPSPPASGAPAGRWVSAPHASYTNAAMVSADFFLDISFASESFRGSWARYVCFAGAYGIMSCSKGSIEGSVSGQLYANGEGWIDLQNLGRSSLSWTSSGGEIALELPRNWQGQNVLFRSKLKR